MKKITVIVIAIALILCFVSCKKGDNNENNTANPSGNIINPSGNTTEPSGSAAASEHTHGRATDHSQSYKIEDSGEAVSGDAEGTAESVIRSDSDMNP